jgi:hypothetical protein
MRKNGPSAAESSIERKIIVDREQVEHVLGKLVCALENDEFPYNLDTTRLPQDTRHMPQTLELGTQEHAMFLWTVCYYMRGGTKSNDAVRRMSLMYDDNPDMFVAANAKDIDKEVLAKTLGTYGLGFQDTVAHAWVENASRLHELYDGDPRRIFDEIDTYQQSLDAIMNDGKGGGFIGFKEKMTSMIIYYLADGKLIEPFEFPLPVDLHVLRVSIANELVKFEGYEDDENLYSDELLETVRNLYVEYARDHDIDMLKLCNAVWQLSESTCGFQPGNITLEPQGRQSRKGRSTVLVPFPVNTNSEAQRIMYDKTCRQCPVEDTCKWNVPGKTYYVQGGLSRRGERVVYPEPNRQEELF